jgi:hypothetical protein
VTASKRPPTRPAARPAVDWAAAQYEPNPGTPLLRCHRCGASWLDDKPGRVAHVAVFGHSPRDPEPEPAEPDEEFPF